ncbi:ParB/RepB/Spo0J family partition protein [Pirellulaceae bacterium SH449]
MTKDRRLGRGLAALLGTPVEEGAAEMAMGSTPQKTSAQPSVPLNSPSGAQPAQAASASAANVPATTNANRSETIRQLATDAKANEARSAVSPISVPVEAPASSLKKNDRPDSGSLAIPTNLIDPNPFQPRRQFLQGEIESLAESIKQHQQLQPILVRKVQDRYQLISGERRLRATIHAGLPTIRAEVRVADDRLVAELAIIENLQRKDLNAVEKAMSFKRYLTEHRCTQEELANRIKIDRSTIANLLRLLELPEGITDAIQREEITAGHAKALLSLGSIKEQHLFVRKIVEHGWSVRETERQVAEAVASSAASEDGILGIVPNRRPSKSSQLQALESDLKMKLGTKVEINQSGRGKGRITIHFTSVEEFDRIRALLASEATKRSAA